MYLLLGRKSKLSTNNKLLIYKTILKLIWTYGIQLWGTASTSSIEIIERFQSKALPMIVDAPLYVPNTLIRRDLQTPVKEEIRRYSSQYSVGLSTHKRHVSILELKWRVRHFDIGAKLSLRRFDLGAKMESPKFLSWS
jgi:hypothetical protein